MPPQQQVDRAFGVGKLRRRQVALSILPRKAAGFQERVAVAQREIESRPNCNRISRLATALPVST